MASPRRALVLDANILIRAVLGQRVRELILDNADRVHFFTPNECIEDAKRYLPEILQSKGIDPGPAMEMLDLLLIHVQGLENEWLEDYGSNINGCSSVFIRFRGFFAIRGSAELNPYLVGKHSCERERLLYSAYRYTI